MSLFQERWISHWEREKEERPLKTRFTVFTAIVAGALCLWAAASMPWTDGWKLLVCAVFPLAFGLLGWRELQRPIRPDRHTVTVYRDGSDYWASCKCGWSGDDRSSEDRAFSDAYAHSPLVQTALEDLDAESLDDLGYILVSRQVVEDGKHIGVLFREESPDPRDSGWRLYHGDESEAYLGRSDSMIACEVQQVLDLDRSVEPVLLTPPPCGFDRSEPGAAFDRRAVRYSWTQGDANDETT